MAKSVRGNGASNALAAPGDAQGRRRALVLLLRERRRLREKALAARGGSPDPLEVAQDLEEEQVWLVVLDRSYEAQVQMEAALELLAEGRYGRCVDCGKAISGARLQALPFALRCVTCQEHREMRETPPGAFSTFLADPRLIWDT